MVSRLRAGASLPFQCHSDLSGHIHEDVTMVWGQGLVCEPFDTDPSALWVLVPLLCFQRSPAKGKAADLLTLRGRGHPGFPRVGPMAS